MNGKAARTGEKLISGSGILLLGAVAVAALALLHSNVRQRAEQAATSPSSTIALQYLQLAMDEAPNDADARFSFARAAMDAARFDRARAALAPLRTATNGSPPSQPLLKLSLELERRAHASVPESQFKKREHARRRYIQALRTAHDHAQTVEERLKIAHAAEQAGARQFAARIWNERVRKDKVLDTPTVAKAASFPLANGHPLEAARLYAFAALERKDPNLAQRALKLALSSDAPVKASRLFDKLRPHFPNDDALLALGLRIADAAGQTALAFDIAEMRLSLAPAWGPRHDDIARRAAWLGDSRRQLVEEIWLAEHMTDPALRDRALKTARAIPNYQAELRLLAAPLPPFSRRSVWQRIEILEALGQPEPALTLLVRATSAALANDAQLWTHRIALELATDRTEDAIASLEQMDRRFGSTAKRVEQRVQLLFRTGRHTEALDQWSHHVFTANASYGQLSHLANLAFELSRPALARQAYEQVLSRQEATAHDYHRLHALLVAAGQRRRARSVAEQGLARFDTVTLFELALNDARQLHDSTRARALVEQTANPDHPLYYDMRYVALRISRLQSQAAKARLAHKHSRAAQLLLKSHTELSRPDVHDVVANQAPHGNASARLAALAYNQQREELSLALATNHQPQLSRLYALLKNELTASERVTILHQLERDEEALSLALLEIDSAPTNSQTNNKQTNNKQTADSQAALRRDAEYLAAKMPRLISAQAGTTDYGPLHSWWVSAGAEYSWQHWGLNVETRFDNLVPDSQSPGASQKTQELRAQLGTALRHGTHRTGAKLGIDLRNGSRPRPYLLLDEATPIGSDGASLQVHAAVNETADDSTELRLHGVRDNLGISATVPLMPTVSLQLSATGHLWSNRDRRLVGGGATAEGIASYHLFEKNNLFQFNINGIARIAPRFNRGNSSPLHLPGSNWLGAGATVAYGDDRRVAIRGKRVSFHLNGALGWLLPQQQAGYYIEGALSIPILSGDALSLRAHASNAVGNTAGQSVYGGSANYTLHLR